MEDPTETREAWAATVADMTEPPLTDDELEALRTVLFETGEGIPREAQLELMQTALWLWARSPRPKDPGRGALKAAGEVPPAVAAGYLRGIVSSEPDLPERVRVQLGVVEDALERAGAMIDEVYDTWAETEDAEARAEVVRALVGGWRG